MENILYQSDSDTGTTWRTYCTNLMVTQEQHEEPTVNILDQSDMILLPSSSIIPGSWFCTNGAMWFLTTSTRYCKPVTAPSKARRMNPPQPVQHLRQAVVQEWQLHPATGRTEAR